MKNIISHVKLKLKSLYSTVGLEGEILEDVPLMQHYGFKSVPIDGEGIILSVNGSRSNPVLIATKGTVDIDIDKGETAIFADGNSIILRKDGSIEISANNIKFAGDLTVSGTLTATGDIKAMGKSLATHIHSTPSGPSGPPI